MLLEIDHVSKQYPKGPKANDDISLSVEAGEVFGLLGPNGAGKSTLMNQIIALLTPTSGTIRIDGVDVAAHPDHARRACSYQPQAQAPIDGLTPLQAVEIVGRIRGGEPHAVRQRARELVKRLDIGEWANKTGQQLSGGVKRLTAFCMAAVVPGRIVILDEPTNDVDPLRRRLLWEAVRLLADEDTAVLLVTHNVLEAERSVGRLAIIDKGKVVGIGTPAALKNHVAGYSRIELVLEPGATLPALPPFLTEAVAVGGRRQMAQVSAADVGAAVAWANGLRDQKVIEEFAIGPATLEDVYVRMVGQPDSLSNGNGRVEVQRG